MSTENEDLPKSSKNEVLANIINDITVHGGVHIIGSKQVGKSNLKKQLASYTIQNCPKTKTIIIDPEGSWEFDFDSIRFLRIPKNAVKIVEEPIGVRLNGSVFTKKTYRLNPKIEKTAKQLTLDDEPILFILEFDDPEECGFFSSYVLELIYDYQRIKRKYWKNNLPRKFLVVLEEAENIFDQSSLEKRLFNTLRKKYAEMANLKIGILSSSQRLTEVNKKFRAKMYGYLIGYLNPDEYIGQIERMLNKISENPTQILNPDFRHKFLYTPTDSVIQTEKFTTTEKPYEIRPQIEKPQTQQPTKKKGIFAKFLDNFRNPLDKAIEEHNQRAKEPKTYFEDETEEWEEENEEEELSFFLEEEEWS
jgi:hypothetical protein